MSIRNISFSLLLVLLLAACGSSVPTEYNKSQQLPAIYPDYCGVTVPQNIAPLNFLCDGDAAKPMVARFTTAHQQIVCSGNKIEIDTDDWRTLVADAIGKAIKVEVFIKTDGQWTLYKPFNIYVSADSIDPYISYRLISPSYVSYEELTISQRCLENFSESVIYDNMLCSTELSGQCINCHSYQQYNPQRMQFHARQNLGGTVVAYDGKLRKINMKHDSLLSAGVYPAWHPTLPLIVYSTNSTHQTFHTTDPNKIEVFDSASDLIAYDVEHNRVVNIENDSTEFEVFPAWSPDGTQLYYCSAHFEFPDSIQDKGLEVITRSYSIKYNIYRKRFNPQTGEFSPRELVFDAAAMDKSATLPRISPDGRFLMFTLAEYGVFHIWHRDADLWMLNLRSMHAAPAKALNSPDTESYHSWSSNGRWVVFSSRRYDGNYTRPFIAHVDSKGRQSKPFELPCADPDYHRQFMKCYNVPEFMSGPVTITPQQFADILKTAGETVSYGK